MTAAPLALRTIASEADALTVTERNSAAGAPDPHRQTPPSHLQLALVSDRAGFDALEADWNDLFARAGASHQLFLTFNWLWHWCNHYLPAQASTGRGARLSILTGRRNGQLIMVWPLVVEPSGGLSVLSWMGDPVSQYGDVLIDDLPDTETLLAEAWAHIRHTISADVARLRKVRADARVAPLLARLGGEVTERLEAPFLDLASAENFAAYEQRYSGSARRNRRRLFRRLDEQGAVTLEEITSGGNTRELIHLAVELKRKWLDARGLVSKAYADDRFARFFAEVAHASVRPAGCRLAVLNTAGRPIAMEVALTCKERVALHIIVFDLEFEKSGAGVLLLEQSIRNASNAGYGCYDLLAPNDTYKLDWADGTVAVQDWAVPMSAAGTAYAKFYLGRVRPALKAAVAALPQDVRRRLAGALSRLMTRA
ncbi:MAG: GNAT family N-acetyltransferase [Hyphomicrobium sp.]